MVLSEAELCARAEAYGHLVDVAAECLALRNFNGVCTALASLELVRTAHQVCPELRIGVFTILAGLEL